EFIYVLAGEGTLQLSDRSEPLGSGVFLMIPRGVSHAFAIKKKPLVMFSTRAGEKCGGENAPMVHLLLPPPPLPRRPPAPPELYRFVLIQAAPGRLLDLIDLYKKRLPVIAAGGDEAPFIVRHSQGDRWDLLVIYPSGSFTSYYSAERVRRREAAAAASGVTGEQFAKQFYDLVAWHEDVYVEGPPLAAFRDYVRDV